MKKKLFFWVVIIFIIAIIGGIYIMFFNKTEIIGNFELTSYKDYVERFPSEKVLGSIDSFHAAKENAEIVWIELYGDSIKNKKPYDVSFDEKNQVWLVQGNIPSNMLGGVPHILIQKIDGKVLAVWHDK